MNSTTGRAGIIRARDDSGGMDKLAHSVLDDILHNLISDLLIKVHRDEKEARATTAAIRIEKLASDASEDSTPESKTEGRVENEAAIYEDGKVLLKGNPLRTISDILCPNCHLPRLLYPTEGKGSRKPDPNTTYCKKQPYIKKAGCDIYGQSWVPPGPGRGKKKKEVEKKDEDDKPTNVLSFPSATCSKCKRCILVTRLNNHMGSCIGNSGRNASRAAAQKLNGNSSYDNTPSSSQKVTPGPGSRSGSPRKRDMTDDSDDSDSPKKKKQKGGMMKKVVIKHKNGIKAEKARISSQLSFEHKIDDDDSMSEMTPTKPLHKAGSPIKKIKAGRILSSPLSKRDRDTDMESEISEPVSSP